MAWRGATLLLVSLSSPYLCVHIYLISITLFVLLVIWWRCVPVPATPSHTISAILSHVILTCRIHMYTIPSLPFSSPVSFCFSGSLVTVVVWYMIWSCCLWCRLVLFCLLFGLFCCPVVVFDICCRWLFFCMFF
jgi:hypothetical protein